MAKHSEYVETREDSAPETFEEALAFAIKALSEAGTGLPPDWLAALDREKENSSS